MIERRDMLLACLGAIGLFAGAARQTQDTSEWGWIYGEWRSDVEMTMATFTFQKKRPTPENLAKISELFGKITHAISPGKFEVMSSFNNMKSREEHAFSVSRHTSSSVTLRFRGKEAPPELTLYKGAGFYMIRAGDNFECFKKVA